MKKIYTLLVMILILLAGKSYSQAPQAIPYQAVARDNAGNLIINQNISLRFGIYPTAVAGILLYQETHSATTNVLGLFVVNVGQGTPTSGTFASIDWSSGDKYLETQIDVTGGTNYTIMGRTKMLSVPFALLSANSTGGWNLSGNSGTNPSTNFIGTTDAQPLVFKVNNDKAGLIDWDYALGNTGFGYQSLNSNTSGIYNTANGYQTLFYNTLGANNTANGFLALHYNTEGEKNTANGAHALLVNTTGNFNTANGFQALSSNTTGSSNTANGIGALSQNTTGHNNTANGDGALSQNTTGHNNTANGYYSLVTNKAGNNSVAIGYQSQYLINNTTTSWDNTNTTIGYNSLRGSFTPANNTGKDNTAVGRDALLNNSAGGANTATGYRSLTSNTTGNNNTSIGSTALQNNVDGNLNSALGYASGVTSSSLSNTTCVGANATVSVSNTMIFGSSVVGWGFGVAPGAAAIRAGTNGTNGNGATLTLAGAWTNGSDSTKKNNIHSINYGLNEIMKLKPVSYQWKIGGQQDFGFLAQEMKMVLPEIVFGEEGQMTISYGQITSVLTKAMQEQQEQIEQLKAENKKLNAENSSFKLDIEKIKTQLGIETRTEN